jgi:ubiquinone/menaquinone biosynthesis C-methylase UbiE
MSSAVERQKAYYANTASHYDNMHDEPEHLLALHLLTVFIELHNIRSILDVGAGTGRAMGWLKQRFPDLVVKGVEPVEQLRKQAYAKGIWFVNSRCSIMSSGRTWSLQRCRASRRAWFAFRTATLWGKARLGFGC